MPAPASAEARAQQCFGRSSWVALVVGLSLQAACGDQDTTAVEPSPSPEIGSDVVDEDQLAAPEQVPPPGAPAPDVPPVDNSKVNAGSGAKTSPPDIAANTEGQKPVVPAAGDIETPPPVVPPVVDSEPGPVDPPETDPVDPPEGTEGKPEPVDPPEEPAASCEVTPPPACAEEPTEPEPWVSGINERPAAAALDLPTTLNVAPQGWTTAEAFPALSFENPTTFNEPNGTGKIFVSELVGRIWAFDNDPAVAEKQLVLDISARTQGFNDAGLIGVAFHPEFGQPDSPNKGYVYLNYAFSPNPIVGEIAPATTITYNRLARFTMDLETRIIDPDSELVLIDQMDEHLWHQGGDVFFNTKDGFLYLSSGDEGGYLCTYDNCQRLDKDLFGGVIRIDVDMKGGDISHPIPRQPETGVTANYYIPNDNPFVGQPGVLEEFYALGLRSPHRMSYDAIDDIAWIGDVGQTQTEELDVLRPGANFQWYIMEGSFLGGMPMPADPLGVWTNPVMEFSRWDSSCIIGGYVYRGSRFPALYGKYVFGDYVKGNLFALEYAYDGDQATAVQLEHLAATPYWGNNGQGMISFGRDRAGELYFLTVGAEAKVHTLARTDGFSNAPLLLSETGVFLDTDSAELEPTPGLLPYDVQSPLWSDGAHKQRWISVPDGANVGFSETGSWAFPEGTVLVKHFDLALDEARPDALRRLETRVLVHGADDQYYGLSYKWNEAGTDADLLLESEREPIDVRLSNGQTRRLEYFYPGPTDCAVCHNDGAGSVLGVRTQQLNHAFEYPETGRSSNQVFTWAQTGLLDVDLDETEVLELDSLVAPADPDATIETRVRSYWASNCSMCHGSGVPDIRANWNARFDVPLEEQGVINGPSQSSLDPDAVLVLPGYPERSVLYQRSSTDDRGFAMPPLGRSVPDPEYVALLKEWICSLATGAQGTSCLEAEALDAGAAAH